MRFISKLFTPEDWKKGVAFVILWAYAYQLVAYPALFWAMNILTLFTGHQFPAPVILPWEQLMSGTTTLGVIGGIETWRQGRTGSQETSK